MEDIYRRYEHVGSEEEDVDQDIGEDRHGEGSREEDYDGEVSARSCSYLNYHKYYMNLILKFKITLFFNYI